MVTPTPTPLRPGVGTSVGSCLTKSCFLRFFTLPLALGRGDMETLRVSDSMFFMGPVNTAAS